MFNSNITDNVADTRCCNFIHEILEIAASENEVEEDSVLVYNNSPFELYI